MSQKTIVFTWKGLPFYGARCLAAFRERYPDVNLHVVATEASVPFEGINDLLKEKIIWVKSDDSPSRELLRISKNADLFVSCGWATPVFNRLASVARSNGARVVLFADNNFEPKLSTFLRAFYYRCYRKKNYDCVWVPGASGRKLFRLAGVPIQDIYEGIYSADENIFLDRNERGDRSREILFTGQLIHRKGVLELCTAFKNLHEAGKENRYKLIIVGSGPLEDEIRAFEANCSGIQYRGFVQPRQLAEMFGSARFFILPSRQEHWGVVVHEACLSGCIPILSRFVGSADDFLRMGSSSIIKSVDAASIERSLGRLLGQTDQELNILAREAYQNSRKFSTERWCSTLHSLVTVKGAGNV